MQLKCTCFVIARHIANYLQLWTLEFPDYNDIYRITSLKISSLDILA